MITIFSEGLQNLAGNQDGHLTWPLSWESHDLEHLVLVANVPAQGREMVALGSGMRG